MNKLLKVILGLVLLPFLAMADNEVRGTINESASGTTSATVFIKEANEFANITDIGWRLDAGVSTGLIIFRSGDTKFNISSATSGSGTVVWFANTGTVVAAQEYIIIYDESAGTYLLRQVQVATTTSVTVSETISVGLTTSDLVWSVSGNITRPVPATTSLTTGPGSIWLPRNTPTAVTVDGNTTACRISVSGIRTNYR